MSSRGFLDTSRAHPGAQGVAKNRPENANLPKETPKRSAGDPEKPQRASQKGPRRPPNGAKRTPRDVAESVGSENDKNLKNDDALD